MFGGAARWAAVALVSLLVAGCRVDGGGTAGDTQAAQGCVREQRCVRVDFPFRHFVPQGLALAPGNAAYLSGYQWKPQRGRRHCQVVKVDRRSGAVLAASLLPECRHGGGAVLTRHGLWVTGPSRLWLLDPEAIGRRDPVLREWAVDKPITASTLTTTGSGLLMATFAQSAEGHTYGFDFAQLMAPGATTLVDRGEGAGRVAASTVRDSPAWVQGVTHDRRGTWFASSSTYCGALTLPSGRRVALVPGAEGLGFDHKGDLWVVSESSAGPYALAGDRPRTPTLTRIPAAELRTGGEPDCAWD
ncbi:hypothetical protein [Nocardioides sp.]|uniref:hypothetical protein n=1 Tax=Nocardioides sp. TaxID=35761 RepID=UPI003D0B9AD3